MESTNHLQKEYGTQRPFTVPENYFSELSSRVMAQIPAEEQKETVVAVKPRRAMVHYLRPLAAAAMTIGVVLVGFLAYMSLMVDKGNMLWQRVIWRRERMRHRHHRKTSLIRQPITS